VTDLGLLPGGTVAGPHGLNNHGDVVGSAGDSNGVYQPFLYRDGRMTQITMGISGYAVDINDAGYIVGQGVVPPENRYHCFLITPNGTIDLNEQTGFDLWPWRMNQLGQIVGNSSATFEAFVWSNGVVRLLGKLGLEYWSNATDINNVGLTVGAAGGPDISFPPSPLYHAVLFQGGQPSSIGFFPGGTLAGASAVNDRGEVVGSSNSESNASHAFVYRGGPLIDLGTLPEDFKSSAHDINNAGQIIGISEGAGEVTRPFLYQDGVMHDLNDLLKPHSGWHLFHAGAINDKGQIIGVGYHNGLERPFLLTPVNQKKNK
jgi:probable HAF family extracellular repeat protein